MSAVSYRRRAVGVFSALVMALCGPLAASSTAQAQQVTQP